MHFLLLAQVVDTFTNTVNKYTLLYFRREKREKEIEAHLLLQKKYLANLFAVVTILALSLPYILVSSLLLLIK